MTLQTTPSRDYTYGLDGPNFLQAPEGLLKLGGWIFARDSTAGHVRLRLGSAGLFDCQPGVARPDVAATHPDVAGAAESGFQLEAYVSPGFHVGTLEYRRAGSGDWIPFHTLSVVAGLSPLQAELDSALPGEGDSEWYVHGWCFHPQCEIMEVSVQFAHQRVALRHGSPRPDVAGMHPQFRTALDSGFSGHLPIKPGRGAVELRVRLSDGSVLRHRLVPEMKIADRAWELATETAANVRASLIRIPPQAQPDVSIVIPIHNQLELTLGCLESLVRHAGKTTFEVIIIDDTSAAHVPRALGLVGGLRLFSNETNQGFVLNCNRGAAEARGRYVLFLNNDIEVSSGWLESMIEVFALRPNAGAVGAKLIYPDGRLQEAGGIIGHDGTGWNYGRSDDPDRPEYNYLRQVDYCSGACLLVPRQLFLDLGGFDERYKPAYYEDADLAFAIRAAGKEVYYQPAARIVHFEGVSSGTDVRTGVKRYQVINREKFAMKWAHVLGNASVDPSMIDVARDRHAPCRILVVDACALTPDADSGSLRMYNLLQILAGQGAKVTFVATNLQSYEPYSTRLRLAGIEHLGVPHLFNLRQYLENSAYAFDVIVLSRKGVAHEWIDVVRQAAPAAKIVFDTVDLMYLRLERQAELERSDLLRAEAESSKAVELELCAKADLVFVVSPVEADLLMRHIPKEKICLVSNIHATYPGVAKFTQRKGVMFVGGFQHPPNVDAVLFFLTEILPLVRRRLPDIDVHIVGSNMPASLRARGDEHVHMHGFVPDLNELYSQVRLTIAPLRYGAGVKGKVNQSMAHAVPVVATTPAIEGMHLAHNQDVLAADTAADFADAIVRVHEDESLWNRISAGGLRNIERHFSFASVESELLRALGPALFKPSPLPRPLPRRAAAIYQPGERLDFGAGGNARAFMREGWAQPDVNSSWIVGRKAVLEFMLPEDARPVQIKALIYPFIAPGRNRQRLQLVGPALASNSEIYLEGRAEPTEVVWTMDPAQLRDRHLCLLLLAPDATAPSSLGLSADVRELSFAFLGLTIQ